MAASESLIGSRGRSLSERRPAAEGRPAFVSDAEPVIRCENLGIKFRRNRGNRRQFKDLFSSKTRRSAPDEFWALRDVTFAVQPGEAMGIVGRNGQGKSTLLKLVAGVILPDEGSVEVSEGVAPLIEITGGFVDDLTVRDNIFLTAGLHGMTRKEVEERFDEIIAFADIGPFIDTPYRHLSSGMKVRIAFAVIARLEEPILLVDEVLAVGDRNFKEKCYTRIHEMIDEGRTLFIVSHNEKDIRDFCSRGLYLDNGGMVIDGPIDDVLELYNEDYSS